MTKLHVFDMDGTLLSGSACLELCRQVGRLDDVQELEEAWHRGEIGHVRFYQVLVEMWEPLSEDDIESAFGGSAWLHGVQDVLEDIAARGEHSAIITLSPHFFVERLIPWGVSTVHGAQIRAREPVIADNVLTPESKPAIVKDLLARYGLAPTDCVAFGDSSSDIPLFRSMPNTVGVNASQALRPIAAVCYEGSDLREAYQLGRTLLAGASVSC